MKKNGYKTAKLGDLVAAVFDEAEQYSSDPLEVSRLATRAVTHMLRRARWKHRAPYIQHQQISRLRLFSDGAIA